MTTNQSEDEYEEDIVEIILSHFPNASRKVCQEMLEETQALISQKVIEARKTGYIDGVNADKRNVEQIALENTIQSLDNLKMYALDCTFGRSFVASHDEKAVPLKSIQSRIDYFTSEIATLTQGIKEQAGVKCERYPSCHNMVEGNGWGLNHNYCSLECKRKDDEWN